MGATAGPAARPGPGGDGAAVPFAPQLRPQVKRCGMAAACGARGRGCEILSSAPSAPYRHLVPGSSETNPPGILAPL